MGTHPEDEFSITLEPVRRESLWTIAALQGDLTPLHWNDDAVREMGAGDRPLAQGSMLVELIARSFGEAVTTFRGYSNLEVRFRRPVFVDDRLVISGQRLTESQEWTVTVENQDGVLVAEAKMEHSAPDA